MKLMTNLMTMTTSCLSEYTAAKDGGGEQEASSFSLLLLSQSPINRKWDKDHMIKHHLNIVGWHARQCDNSPYIKGVAHVDDTGEKIRLEEGLPRREKKSRLAKSRPGGAQVLF